MSGENFWQVRDRRYSRNLTEGLWMFLTHPELTRTCAECKAWVFDDTAKRMGSEKAVHRGLPMARPSGDSPPCYMCPRGRPDGKPHPEKEMTGRTWAAYRLFLEIRAGFPMPNDAIVRRNCGLIQMVLDSYSRSQATGLSSLLSAR